MCETILNENTNYENLIRKAFNCKRWADPLRLADTDVNDRNNLPIIQLGVAYALRRAYVRIENEGIQTPNEIEIDLLSLITQSIQSNSYEELHTIINQGNIILDQLEMRIG